MSEAKPIIFRTAMGFAALNPSYGLRASTAGDRNHTSLRHCIQIVREALASAGRPMPETWLVIAVLAPMVAYGFVCAYQLAYATIADAALLIALTSLALGAGYLFG